MATGENSGTWGTITNTNLGTTLEEAICRSVDVAFSGDDVTLTASDSNGTQSFRNLRLNLTGTGSAGISLIVPDIEKNYIINNGLSTDVDVKNSSGGNVTIQAGKTNLVYSTGSGVVDVVNSLSTLVVEGTSNLKGATTFSGGVSAASIVNIGGNVSVAGTLTVGSEGVNTFVNGDCIVASGMEVGSVATFSSNVTLGSVSNAVTSVNSQMEFNNNLREKTFLNTISATSTFNYSLLGGGILFNQSSSASNFQLNLQGDTSTTLNEIMVTGETTTFAMLNTNGPSAHYVTAILIDGTTASPIYWQGGSKPDAGNASSIDSYSISITKTGSAQYTTLASLTQFGLDNY